MSKSFKVESSFQPAGDQPQAIRKLVEGAKAGLAAQTLLGVTGSGKTFTMAHVVEQLQRPTIVMAHNKTLAAQLYGEFKEFFPHNAVEYFVSYYDYYQPEAYVPSSDTYIEKDASVNEHIEQMRLSATKALLERRDTIIVATVSAIYGLGDPTQYLSMVLHVSRGELINQRSILRRLAEMQYSRNDMELRRGTYRVRGDVIDVFPGDEETQAVRIELFDEEVENISLFDPLTGEILRKIPRITIYPKSHYVTPRQIVLDAVQTIGEELKQRLEYLRNNDCLVEAQRLEQRTRYDMEMMLELGYCNGIENYSRHLTGRGAGESPPTLFDYLPEDALLVLDESHVLIPQLNAMYKGDRSRKENLVTYGFRLPSALDNRPLKFEEWAARTGQVIFLLPEMAGGAELAEIIQGQRSLAAFQQLLHRNLCILGVPFSPIIKQGGEDAPVGGHERIFHLLHISRMAPLGTAGLFRHPQIAGIDNHALMGVVFINGLGIAEMTGRATDHLGRMSGIRFFVLVAGQAHF